MKTLFQRWIQRIRSNYANPLDRSRALALTWINLGVLVAWLLLAALHLVPRFASGADRSLLSILMIVLPPILIYVIHALTQNFQVRWALRITVAGLVAVALSPIALRQTDSISTMLLFVPVVAAGVMLNRRDTVIVILMVVLGAAAGALGIDREPGQFISDTAARELALTAATLILTGIFFVAFTGRERTVVETAMQVQDGLDMLGKMAANTQQAHDENAVLVAVSDYITEDLLYAACHIYLFDGQGNLNRFVRTGMGTRHAVSTVRLEIEDDNAIAEAIRTRQTVTLTAGDPPARRSHLLPSSLYGAAIPLLRGSQVLGVLDIQSSEHGQNFQGVALRLLQAAAGTISGAFVRVRETALFERTLREQETIANNLRDQLEEIRQREEAPSGDWSSYIQGRGTGAFGFDLRRDDMSITPASDLPETLRPALARGEPVIHSQGNIQIVNVPILFREEVLGAMAFTLPPGRQITDRQMDMARTVAQRLALALENARLVEQSQAQATRERRAGEISSLLMSQQDVMGVLRTAAERFNDALGAVYTQIYLDPEGAPAPAQGEEAAP